MLLLPFMLLIFPIYSALFRNSLNSTFIVIPVYLGLVFFIYIITSSIIQKYKYSIEEDGITIVNGIFETRTTSLKYSEIREFLLQQSIIGRLMKLYDIQILPINFSIKNRGIYTTGRVVGLSKREAEEAISLLREKLNTTI